MMQKGMVLAVISLLVFAGWGSPIQGEDKENNVIADIGFENGIADWKDYGGIEPKPVMSQSSEEAHSGKYSLKIEAPGANPLEGVITTIKVNPKNRYLVSVYAKGEGKVMLCSTATNGWLYGKETNLTSEWQELKISMFTRANTIIPNIITIGKAQKVTFYLDDLRIVRESLSTLPEIDLAPVKIEAEDYPVNSNIVKDSSAGGGAYAEGFRWYELAGNVPYPQTSKPVYIYLKVWLEENTKHIISIIHNIAGQGIELMGSFKVPAPNKWQWVKAGPFLPGEIIEKFTVSTDGPDPAIKTRLDSVVISTKENLTDQELDVAKGPQ